MRAIAGALLLILATLTPQRTLYAMPWYSPLPVQLSRVEVTGGSLVQVLASSDGLSGTIAATAPRACLSIAAEGQTTAGVAVRFSRSWEEGCGRVWLPWVGG